MNIPLLAMLIFNGEPFYLTELANLEPKPAKPVPAMIFEMKPKLDTRTIEKEYD